MKFNEWSDWLNLDSQDGDGDLELFELKKNQTCSSPSRTQIVTVNSLKPFNETNQTVHYSDCFGFMCLNRENEGGCLDYQFRQCCPSSEIRPDVTAAPTTRPPPTPSPST